MTLRRLVPFFLWCSQKENPLDMDPKELEKWFHKFDWCFVPHKNLNDVGTQRLIAYLEKWNLKDLFTEGELQDLI